MDVVVALIRRSPCIICRSELPWRLADGLETVKPSKLRLLGREREQFGSDEEHGSEDADYQALSDSILSFKRRDATHNAMPEVET